MKPRIVRRSGWGAATLLTLATSLWDVPNAAGCYGDYWNVNGTVTLAPGGPGCSVGMQVNVCGGFVGFPSTGCPVFVVDSEYYANALWDGSYSLCAAYPGYKSSKPTPILTCQDSPSATCLRQPPPAGCENPPPHPGQCNNCLGSFEITLYPITRDPEARSCPNVGRPVNVLNGNVWLDQTDAVLPGVVGLRFVRAYNSVNAPANLAGPLGRGWTFTYGRKLVFTAATPNVILLEEDDGEVLYFEDDNQDLLFQPLLPKTEESSILKTGTTYVRSFLAGGTEAYDAQGRLMSITDPAGNTVTLTRDSAGKLLSITDPGARTLTLDYDSGGRIRSLSGPTGPLASYRYNLDSLPLMERVSYPDGTGYAFTYDSSARLLSVTDFGGRVVEQHTYDAAGRGLTSSLADDREKYTIAYPGLTTTTVTDALGNTTTYEWAGINGIHARVTRIVGPCPSCGGGGGDVQEFTYDRDGRVVTETDAMGRVTQYTYDGSSARIATRTELFGTADARTTSYTYDAQGRQQSVAGPGGTLTTYQPGPSGPTTITEKVTATENRVTQIAYNAQGKPEAITNPRSKVTTLGYHGTTGDMVSVTDPLSHATTFGYDSMGRRTTVTDALNHTTTTTYDALGRVARITSHDGTHTDFEYDKSGRRSRVIDPLGRATSYTYDAYGRLSAVIDAMGGVTRYGYDLMSNLTSLTDAKVQTTAFEYDSHNRVKKVIYPGGAFETFTYDVVGRLATKVDRKSVTTTFGYDVFDRLTSKTYSNGEPAVTYAYNAADRMVTAANAVDTLTWTYDLAGQVLTEQSTKNSSTVAYTYDLGGNRLTLSLDGSLFVSYAYDDASRLTAITRGTNVFTFGYDNANRRTSLAYPNGVNTAYTYDSLDRVLGIVATKDANTIASSIYTYDPAGNRLTKTHPEYAEAYRYDKLYRLTDVDRTGIAKRQRYIYDAIGNRLSEQIDDSVTGYTYNNLNQLLATAGGGTLRWRGTLNEPGNVTFTSATVNGKPARMLAGNVFEADIPVAAGNNAVTLVAKDISNNTATKNYSVDVTGTGVTYTYDFNGNLATKTEGSTTWTYEWTAEDQLKRILNSGTEMARFAYDPLGRRVEKVAGSNATAWTYDRVSILRHAGAATTKYVNGLLDEPLAQEDGSELTFFSADALGSVVSNSDDLGALAGTRLYDAWGEMEAGASASGYAFTGREWDIETGLYYYRARYYDARVGRFISSDPSGLRGGLNLYGYVDNRPTLATDPTGLSSSLPPAFELCYRFGICGGKASPPPVPKPTPLPAAQPPETGPRTPPSPSPHPTACPTPTPLCKQNMIDACIKYNHCWDRPSQWFHFPFPTSGSAEHCLWVCRHSCGSSNPPPHGPGWHDDWPEPSTGRPPYRPPTIIRR